MVFIAFIGLLILLGLSIFQVLLIARKPWGEFAWGGQHRVLPRNMRIASGFSIILYIVFASFLASKAGIANIVTDAGLLTTGMWVFTGYFTLGILMNAISHSKKERMLMTPVAFSLAIVFLVVGVTS